MGFKETTSTLPLKKTTIDWVLCSPHFNDSVLIAPEGLNDTHLNKNYQEVPSKQIKKEYFKHEDYHYRIHGHKRKSQNRKDNICHS